jgi:hypothetical protein
MEPFGELGSPLPQAEHAATSPLQCDCDILNRLKSVRSDSNWKVDELVRVPAAAHGYIDQQSGKQVGSYMTYIISFCVPIEALFHLVRRIP